MGLNPLVDSRDLRFVLFEMLEAHRLGERVPFEGTGRDEIESVLELAERIAMARVYPENAAADREGARFDPATKSVAVPGGFKSAMAAFREAGFPGLGEDPDQGGAGMPDVVCRAVMEYFFAASVSFGVYASLSAGAAHLVSHFAPEDIRDRYLPKMIEGTWGGTMCLTEPEAGTDVGALKTKARKRADGTYLITGQKIFITSGENDLYENMVHPVLARIEGDPPGTKGISIFLVPKYHANTDGTPGERNDVVCSGIEHKMGIRGSATCTLNFGDEGRCVGHLMGEERQGMGIMFRMMNEARLDVALEALGVASSAYLHAAAYARNRLQGSHPSGEGPRPAPIMRHPDVRRMLLWMKSQVEAMRMLTLLAAHCTDISRVGVGDEAREAAALLEFLIPICKAGNSDLSWLVTAEAIQVHGGYGYCADYPVEQLARDSKILSIYEGTNGIQSIDLALRKLLLNPGMYDYSVFKRRVGRTIEGARAIVGEEYRVPVRDGLARMDEVVDRLKGLADSGDMTGILAVATPLLRAFRMLSHAWMHLWSLSLCLPKLEGIAGGAHDGAFRAAAEGNAEAAYYYGRVLSARLYLRSEFCTYPGILEGILSGEDAVACSFEGVFSGVPE